MQMQLHFVPVKEKPTIVVKDNDAFPVIIIGGGPAGLATSFTLRARKVPHVLIDAQTEPSRKPGEALSPNALPLLKKLGIAHLLDHTTHQRYYGLESCWGSEKLEGKSLMSELHRNGYLLDRRWFETQLRGIAQQTAHFFGEGFRLKQIQASMIPDQKWEITIEHPTENQTFRLYTQWVVDATGRKASVCRHLGQQKQAIDEQFALVFRAKIDQAIPQQIWVEATRDGWWYVAPFDKQHLTMMFFTLKECLPVGPQKSVFLEQALANTIHLQQWLAPDQMLVDEVKVWPAGTSCLELPSGEGWLAVGDAAYAYDPISSFGITSALASGFYGGQAVADLLHDKQEAHGVYRYVLENAFQAYIQQLHTHYSREQRWPGASFWQKRF